jgi:hypothetical protein
MYDVIALTKTVFFFYFDFGREGQQPSALPLWVHL